MKLTEMMAAEFHIVLTLILRRFKFSDTIFGTIFLNLLNLSVVKILCHKVKQVLL